MGPEAKPLSSVGPQGAAAGRGDPARPGGPSLQGGKALGMGAPQPRRRAIFASKTVCLRKLPSPSSMPHVSHTLDSVEREDLWEGGSVRV